MSLQDLRTQLQLSVASTLDRTLSNLWARDPSIPVRALDLSELEERILLSASPAAVMVESANAAPADLMAEESVMIDSSAPSASQTQTPSSVEQSNSNVSTSPSQNVSHEIVFLDTSVDDYLQLLDDLWSNDDPGREIEVVLLSSSRDGIEQISEALAGRSDLDAIHIVSHGTDASVKLGSTWLTQDNLAGYVGEISRWSNALSVDADLLFYGCELAASADGQDLIDSLATLTGADVAASNDDTGHAIFGADWDFEYAVGQIETQIAFSQDVQDNWGHVMNVAVDATSTGTSTGGSISVSHTTSGTDRLMLVGVSINKGTGTAVTSITYDSSSLTLVGSRVDGDTVVEIWSLLNPSLGTHNVDITFNGTTDGNTAGVMTFTGVDQATPLGTFAENSGVANNGSVTVGSATNDLVFGVISVDGPTDYDLISGGGQTEDWDLIGGPDINGGGSTKAGAASVGLSWTWTGTDNWAAAGVSIKPAATNTAPTISLSGSALNYTENDGAVVIDATATASDSDSTNFDTGTLTADFTANGTTNDRLAINNEGTGSGQIGISGSNVSYEGTTIGTFTGGTDGSTPLVITFNANSTPTAAQALMRNVTYENVSENPSELARTVRFVLTDGDGGTSNSETETITVAAVNDAPTSTGDFYSVDEDGTLVVGPTTTNLVDWYELNDGSGQTALDSVAPANDGTLGSTAGADASDPTWVTGHVGSNALSFDGTDDYVETTSTILQTANNFTLSTWFKTDTTTGAHHLLWEGYSGGNGYGSGPGTAAQSELRLSIGTFDQNDKIVFFLGYDVPVNGADSIYIVSESDFTDTTDWHHVAVTVTDLGGGVFSASLYVDGVLEGTDTGTENDRTQWASPLLIGKPGASQRYFDGQIDEVRIYDTDLTATEVRNLALAGAMENDTDPESDILDAILVSGPTDGTLSLESDGSFTYSPGGDFVGVDSFTYKTNDGSLDSNVATVTITVDQVNDAPVGTDDPGDYATDLLALNPISYWRLGESSGANAVDAGSLANDGTYQGTTLAQTGALNGDSNTAVRFNGSSDYAEAAHDNTYLLDDGTIQLWFNSDNPSNGDLQHLFSKDSSGNDTGGHVSMYLTAAGNLEVRFQSTTTSYLVTSPSAVSSGAWHHAAFTFGAQGMELYLDGTLVDTDVYTGGMGTTSGGTGNFEPIAIGAGTQTSGNLVLTPLSEYFTGSIDEVAILGSRLDAEAIQDLYAIGLQNYVVAEDGTLTVTVGEGVLVNDSDLEGDSLTAVIASSPSNAASFTLNADGSFDYTPVGGFTGTDSFTYTPNDGTVNGNVTTVTLTVVAKPVITLPGSAITFTEGDPATIIDATATASDSDSTDFDTGTLTVDFTANGESNDRLAINNEGTGSGQIGVSGSNVTYEGTTIGTFTGGTDGATPLVITFNASSTPVAAQALMRNITYESVSQNPGESARTVRFVLADGDGATSDPATQTVNVTAVNDIPVVADNTVTTPEDEIYTFVLSDFGYSDVDGDSIASIRVSPILVGDFVRLDGVVLPASTVQIIAIADIVAGKLTFHPPADASGTANIFYFDASDGTVYSVAKTMSISVTPENDAPEVDVTGGAVNFTENDPTTVIDASLTVSDVDDTNLTGAVVSITTGFSFGEDVLAFADQLGITGSYNASSGILTLTGTTTVSNYQAALRSVTYENTSDAPSTTTRTISFFADDGVDSSVAATRNVTIAAENDAPVTTADPGDYATDLLALNPLSYWRLGESSGTSASDAGSLSNSGTYNGTTLAQAGAINGDSNTAVRFNGTSDYVEFAHDASYLLDNGTIQLWFNADTASTGTEQHLISKDSSGNDSGGHISVYLRTNGRVEVRFQSTTTDYFVQTASSVSSGDWHHVAVSFGSDGLNLFVDGVLADTDAYTGGLGSTSGGSGNANPIAIGAGTQSSGDNVITPVDEFFGGLIDEVAILGTQLSAESIQDLYAAGLQNYQIVHGNTLTVTTEEGVLANDFDEEGDSLTAIVVTGPSNAASFTLNPDGSFDYTPTAGFSGTDSFTYKANDGTTDGNSTTVSLTVTNQVPVVTLPGAAASYTEGDAATVIDNTATVSDADSTDFNTGTLTVDFTANSTANDRLAIVNEGTGAGQIGVSGSNVTYEGTTIGTFAGGTDGSTPLVVTLNANATVAATQALARHITYENVATDPDTDARAVRFVLTDGDGGTSAAATQTINLSGDNILVVNTTSNVADGTTTSIDALLANRGADGKISLHEAIEATNNTPNGGSPDEIHFEILDALVDGVHTISVTGTGLPTILQELIIDGRRRR